MRPTSRIGDEQLAERFRALYPPEEGPVEIDSDGILRRILADAHEEAPRPGALRGRRLTARTGALSLGALFLMSGAAMAAGQALGVIDLGGGDTAETLTTVPALFQAKDGKSYQVLVPSGAPYTYRLAGGQPSLKCADAEMYVESDRPLTNEQLRAIITEESAGPTHVRSDLLPEGVRSIGQACLPAGPPTGAQEKAQVEAEAAGWTAEKLREQLRARAQRPPAGSATAEVNAAMAQAEAEGWTAKKFREDLHARRP